MSEYADVIVVGAEPAGSTAAAALARQGMKTLLLDREPFPRPKPCGDVVPMGCFTELGKIGLRTFDMERFDISSILIHDAQNAKRFSLARKGDVSTCVVSRTVFDQALYHHALSCGAESRVVNVKGPILDDSRVIGVSGTGPHRMGPHREAQYFSRIVIGADGATSTVARRLGNRLKPDDQWAVAIRGYVDTCLDLDGTIELAFLDQLQPGYAWFFPMETRRANVGVGMRSDFYRRQKRPLGDLLSDYLTMPENAPRIGRNRVEEVQSWSIPFFSFERQRVFAGALLAGDAGGFVHPITAAGIYPAIITGKCAAEAAIRALENGDVSQAGLAHYDTLWRDALAADFRPAVAANKLTTVFPHLVSAALLLSPSAGEVRPGGGEPLPFALGKF